jgi:hypothetical protein
MSSNLKDYAIVVGIDKYSQLNQLTSAVDDAVEFIKWLRSENGANLKNDQIKEFYGDTAVSDPLDAKPIQKDIDRTLRDMGIKLGNPIGRRLYFYFSGHGFARTHDDIGMIMADASEESLNSNLGLRWYRELFRVVPYFQEVIFILDCCRETMPYDYETQPPTIGNIKQLQNSFLANNPTANPPAVLDLVILGAAHAGKSLAAKSAQSDKKRGFLTQALLEALKGEPKAADADGNITPASVRQYIVNRVRELAGGIQDTTEKKEQNPEIIDSNSDGIVFGSIKLPTINVEIKVDPTLQGDLILYDRDKETRITAADLSANGFVWKIKLIKRTSPPYFLENPDSGINKKLDLSKVEVNPYEFQFS